MKHKKVPSERPSGNSSAEMEKIACDSDEDQALLALKRLIYRMPEGR